MQLVSLHVDFQNQKPQGRTHSLCLGSHLGDSDAHSHLKMHEDMREKELCQELSHEYALHRNWHAAAHWTFLQAPCGLLSSRN